MSFGAQNSCILLFLLKHFENAVRTLLRLKQCSSMSHEVWLKLWRWHRRKVTFEATSAQVRETPLRSGPVAKRASGLKAGHCMGARGCRFMTDHRHDNSTELFLSYFNTVLIWAAAKAAGSSVFISVLLNNKTWPATIDTNCTQPPFMAGML